MYLIYNGGLAAGASLDVYVYHSLASYLTDSSQLACLPYAASNPGLICSQACMLTRHPHTQLNAFTMC